MRWTEALQGVRMAVFLNLLHRWESAELNQEEAAERADVPSLDAAGSRRPGRGGGAALSRALPRLHGQALPRASGEGPRLRLGLHLDQASSSVDGGGREGAAQGGAPAQARAASAAGDDAASGRLAPRLARRPGGA